MLTIIVGDEAFDETTEQFTVANGVVLELEHSLVSLSKWEQKFEKPFLAPGQKTTKEILEYIRCMCLTDDIPPEVFQKLSDENIEQINSYIEKKMTATWFSNTKAAKSSETITSELIYYWLTVFSIPFEVQYWHLNRLLTLVKVCMEKNAKPKPMSRAAAAEQQRALNAERKKQLGTRG